MIRLVASDIDGTLIGETNRLPQNNLEAIQAMEKSDIDFTICTRQNLFYDEKLL